MRRIQSIRYKDKQTASYRIKHKTIKKTKKKTHKGDMNTKQACTTAECY